MPSRPSRAPAPPPPRRPARRRSWARALVLSAVLAAFTPRPARGARPPLSPPLATPLAPARLVARELARVQAHPRAPEALARLLRLAPSLSALSLPRQHAALDALAHERLAPRLATLAAWLDRRFLRPSQARAVMEAQGFLTHALVAGPLTAPATAGPGGDAPALVALRDVRAGARLAVGATVAGLYGPTPWRPAPPAGPPGSLNLAPSLPAGRPAAALAVLAVQARGPGRGVLHLGSDAALAVAFNGVVLGAAPAPAHAAPDQLRAPVTVRRGVNLLAVALASPQGRGGTLYVRITDPRGRPLAGVRALAPAPPPTTRGPAPAAHPVSQAATAPWPPLSWRLDADLERAHAPTPVLRWTSVLPPPEASRGGAPTEHAVLRAAAALALGLPTESDQGRALRAPRRDATGEPARPADAPRAPAAPAPVSLARLLMPPAAARLSPAALLLSLPHVASESRRVDILEAHRLARVPYEAPDGAPRDAVRPRRPALDEALALLVADRGQPLRAAALLRGRTPGLVGSLARVESLRQRDERALAWRALGPTRAGLSLAAPAERAPTEATPARATSPDLRPGRANRSPTRGEVPHQPAEAALRAAARVAEDLDRADVAAAIYGRLAAGAPGDETTLALVAQAAEGSGRPQEALTRLAALAARRPDRPGYALEAARVALNLHRADDARSLLRSVVRPVEAEALDPDVLVSAGRLFERLGDLRDARRAYDRALAQRPTSPEALGRLAALGGAGARAPEVWRVPLTATLAATPSRHPEAPFETLVEEIHLRVRADGGFQERRHRVLRVHEVPEDRDGRTFFHRYDPSLVRARVLAARVHRPSRGSARPDAGGAGAPGDGREVALTTRAVVAREESRLSEAWYGLYYDQRELAVPFDDLRPGDLVEIELAVDSVGAPPLPGTFDRVELLQDRTFRHRVVLTVEAPPDLPLRSHVLLPHAARTRGAEVRETRASCDGERGACLVVDARDLPPLPGERYAPGAAEVAALVQLTSFPSWEALVTRYDALIEPQRVLTPAMRRWVAAQVAQATPRPASGDAAPSPNPTLLARALCEGVAQRVRYVGLEFDIHGYQPYRTDQVWSRRFGDCKDQATLLTTLLRAAGIEAHVALVRTRPNGRLPGALPGLALFDHAIVWLPAQGLFFDPTVRTLGLGALPAVDQGSQALVLGPSVHEAMEAGGGEAPLVALQRVPVQPASAAATEGDYTVALAADGAAGLRGVMELRGTDAAPYRERLASPDARAARVETLLNGRYPGLVLEDLSVSNPRALHEPLTLTFSARAPDVGAVAEGADGARTLEVSWPGGASGLLDRWASDAARRLPVVLGPPSTYRFHFTYLLPPGFTAPTLPPGGEAAGPFGRYQIRWTRQSGAVAVETRFTRTVDQVNPARYGAFRAFMQTFDTLARVPLTLVGPAGAAPPPTAGAPPSAPDEALDQQRGQAPGTRPRAKGAT